MRKFINNVWKIVTFPFIWVFNIVSYPFLLLWRIVSFPFILLNRFRKFLNTEPEEHPFGEVVTGLITSTSMRAFLIN